MYVIIDANVLHTRKNFSTADINFLLERARVIGWQLCIPEPVLIELSQGIQESILAAEAQIKKHLDDLPDWKVDRAALEAKYAKRLDDFISDKKIRILPFAKEPPARELFVRSATKKPPFDKNGGSFRDAIIWYSVEEFVRSLRGQYPAIFVTQDNDFITTSSILAKDVPRLQVVTFEGANKYLTGLLKAAQKDRYNRLAEEIRDFLLHEEMQRIDERIAVEVDFRPTVNIGESVVSLVRYESSALPFVDTVSEIGDEMMQFTAKILGTLHYKVKVNASMRAAQISALRHQANFPTKIGQVNPNFQSVLGTFQSNDGYNLDDLLYDSVEERTQAVTLIMDGTASRNTVDDVIESVTLGPISQN